MPARRRAGKTASERSAAIEHSPPRSRQERSTMTPNSTYVHGSTLDSDSSASAPVESAVFGNPVSRFHMLAPHETLPWSNRHHESVNSEDFDVDAPVSFEKRRYPMQTIRGGPAVDDPSRKEFDSGDADRLIALRPPMKVATRGADRRETALRLFKCGVPVTQSPGVGAQTHPVPPPLNTSLDGDSNERSRRAVLRHRVSDPVSPEPMTDAASPLADDPGGVHLVPVLPALKPASLKGQAVQSPACFIMVQDALLMEEPPTRSVAGRCVTNSIPVKIGSTTIRVDEVAQCEQCSPARATLVSSPVGCCSRTLKSDRLSRVGCDLAHGVSATVIDMYPDNCHLEWTLALPSIVDAVNATLCGANAVAGDEQPHRALISGLPWQVDNTMYLAESVVRISVCVLKGDLWRDLLAGGLGGGSGMSNGAEDAPEAKRCQRMREISFGGSPLLGPRLESARTIVLRNAGDLHDAIDAVHRSVSVDDMRHGCMVTALYVMSRHVRGDATTNITAEVLMSSCLHIAGTPPALAQALSGGWIPRTERFLACTVRGARNVVIVYKDIGMSEEETDIAAGILQGLQNLRTAAPVVGSVVRLREAVVTKIKALATHGEFTKKALLACMVLLRRRAEAAPNRVRPCEQWGGAFFTAAQRELQPDDVPEIPQQDRYGAYGLLLVEKAFASALSRCDEVLDEYTRLFHWDARRRLALPKFFPESRYSPENVMARWKALATEAPRAAAAAAAVAAAAAARDRVDVRTTSERSLAGGEGDFVSQFISEKDSFEHLDAANEASDGPARTKHRDKRTAPKLSAHALRMWAQRRPTPNVFAGDFAKSTSASLLPFHAGDGVTEHVFCMSSVKGACQPSSAVAMRPLAHPVARVANDTETVDSSSPTPFTHRVQCVVLLDPQPRAPLPCLDGGDPIESEAVLHREGDHTVVVDLSQVFDAAAAPLTGEARMFNVDEVCTSVGDVFHPKFVSQRAPPADPVTATAPPPSTSSLVSTALPSAFFDFTCGVNVSVMALVSSAGAGTDLSRLANCSLTAKLIPTMVDHITSNPDWELYVSVTEILSHDVLRDHVRAARSRRLLDTAQPAGADPPDQPGASAPELAAHTLAYRAAWTPAGPVVEHAQFQRVTRKETVSIILAEAFGANEDLTVSGGYHITFLLRRPLMKVMKEAKAPWLRRRDTQAGQSHGADLLEEMHSKLSVDVHFSSMQIFLGTNPNTLEGLEVRHALTMESNRNLFVGPYRGRVVVVADMVEATTREAIMMLHRVTHLGGWLRFYRMSAPWSMRTYCDYLLHKASELRGAEHGTRPTARAQRQGESASPSLGPTTSDEEESRHTAHDGRRNSIGKRVEHSGSPRRRGQTVSFSPCDAATGERAADAWMARTTWRYLQRMIAVAEQLLDEEGRPEQRTRNWLGRPHAITADEEVYDLLAPLALTPLASMVQHGLGQPLAEQKSTSTARQAPYSPPPQPQWNASELPSRGRAVLPWIRVPRPQALADDGQVEMVRLPMGVQKQSLQSTLHSTSVSSRMTARPGEKITLPTAPPLTRPSPSQFSSARDLVDSSRAVSDMNANTSSTVATGPMPASVRGSSRTLSPQQVLKSRAAHQVANAPTGGARPSLPRPGERAPAAAGMADRF